MSVKNVTVNDPSRLTATIPIGVKLAIADVVIEFAKMEAFAEHLIWAICGLSFEHGSMLTTMDARPKFDLAKALVKRHRIKLTEPPLPDNFWETAQNLRGYRNQIAHGIWAMANNDTPVAGSYRTRDQHGKRIMADAFSIERLTAIASQCDNVRRYFERLELAFLARPPRRAPQPPEQA